MATATKTKVLRVRTQDSPGTENGKVVRFPVVKVAKKAKNQPPKRIANALSRTREYLTPEEASKLIDKAKEGRYGQRDSTALLIAYRHGLRVSELVALKWEQVDLKAGQLRVTRLKSGDASTHPLRGPELRALRQLRRDWPDSPYVLCSERGGPMTASNIRKMVARSGLAAKLPFPVHPHMLRHGCGYKLANDGQDTRAIQLYLGHRNIQHTVRYTQLSDKRFQDFWKD
jgi:type 1 fimbriae regulatory protein FimE